MKKILLFVSIIVVAAALLIAALFALYGGSWAAGYLSRYLTKSLKVPVTVKNVDFKKNSFVIENLRIANPSRSRFPVAAQFREAIFTTPYSNYLKDPIVINDIRINDLYMNIEFYNKNRTRGNWTTLIENLESNKDESKKKKADEKGRTVLIKYLLITNINIDLIFPGKSPIKLDPIAGVEFRNLSSEKGIPIEEITEIITQQLMKQLSVLKGFQNMIEGLFNLPSKAVEELFNPFRLFKNEPKQDASHEEKQEDLAITEEQPEHSIPDCDSNLQSDTSENDKNF